MTQPSGEFWEQLPEETGTAYAAFSEYRDQGITRSLRRAAADFYAQQDGPQKDTEGTPNPAALRRFKQWSRTHMWVARVEAYDAEEVRKRSLLFQERRIQAAEQQYLVGKVALNAVLRRVAEWQNSGELSEMPDRVVPSLLREAVRTMALALGEPTKIEATAKPRDPDAVPTDAVIARMTEEDLEEMVLLDERMQQIEREMREEGG